MADFTDDASVAVEALIDVLARLIVRNDLHLQHGEDTIGVLMKCGAFHAWPTDERDTVFSGDHFVSELAQKIDAVIKRKTL